MHQRAIAGPRFDRLQPPRLGESRRDVEILVMNRALRWHRVVFGQLEHLIGRADAPAVGEIRERRQVGGVALRRTARDPARNEGLLRGRQTALVGEGPVRRVGVPRRHAAVGDAAADGLRPGPCLGIGEQRHRRDFAGRWQLAQLA